MEKQAAKRGRVEESNESRDFCEEAEGSPPKRLWKEIDVEFLFEINDNGFGCDEIEDMMNMLREEISPSSSCSENTDTGTSSNDSEELQSSADKYYDLEADVEYLLGASDVELGIRSTPELDSVNESGEFFEWFEVEEGERQLLWKTWLGNDESLELDTSDVLFVHDLCMLSSQI